VFQRAQNCKNYQQLKLKLQAGERPVRNHRKQFGQYVGDIVQLRYRGLMFSSQYVCFIQLNLIVSACHVT